MVPRLRDDISILSKIAISEKEQKRIYKTIRTWSIHEWRTLLKRAQDEVVISQVYKNLEQLEKKPSVWNSIKALYYNAWAHKQNLLSESKIVADFLSQHGIDFLFIKGIVVDSLYTKSWRAMADIDILVEDFQGAKEVFLEHGYFLDEMWNGNNEQFGAANLYCAERKAKVDLHFGEYPVHSLGTFHLPLKERCIQGEIPTISYEDNLLVLASHIFNHGFYLMRDINDAYVMLQKELDWKYIVESAKNLRLKEVLYVLLKAASSMYNIRVDDIEGKSSSFLYKYGQRKHFLQHVLQLHHLFFFSQIKKVISYPGYAAYSCFFSSGDIIDPPWVGIAPPQWINRVDRKFLCSIDEQVHAFFITDNPHNMRFIVERGNLYVEKQNLQKKDMKRAKKIVRGAKNGKIS